jgi:hypothetical protein
MATFEKAAGQSTRGWDAKAGQQVIPVGTDADMSLKGPDADGLLVTSSDLTVCTVHEKVPSTPVPGSGRTFEVTALRAGDCQVEARTKAPERRLAASFQVHATASKHAFKLVFFPGERTSRGVTLGSIYVVGGNGERFQAAGGAVSARKDRGGHTSEPTPPGRYILGSQQHVTTGTWPRSAVPYGSRIRLLLDGRIEFESPGKKWLPVTGPKGVVVKYMIEFARRDGDKLTVEECDETLKTLLLAPNGTLRTVFWDLNDFGRWGWNLTRNGAITPYYVHTTPETEWATRDGKRVVLSNSHGCVHITPAERDKMMSLGYLKKGVEFDVRKYSEAGPP